MYYKIHIVVRRLTLEPFKGHVSQPTRHTVDVRQSQLLMTDKEQY